MKKKIWMSVLASVLIIGIAGCSQQEKTNTDNIDLLEESDNDNVEIQSKIDLEQCLGNTVENVGQKIELIPSTQISVDYTADNEQVEFSTSSDGTITDIYIKSGATYSYAGIKCGMNAYEIEEKLSKIESYQYNIDVAGDEVAFWKKDDINIGGFFDLGGQNKCEGIKVTTDFSGLYKLYKEEQPYILFDSVYRELTDEDVEGFDKESLNEAIDEIYAREGMEFNSPEKKALYAYCLWYEPTIPEDEFSDDMLSEVEKYNIQFLKSQIEEINNNEIEKQKVIERGYTEGTYKNPDGYTIVMKNQEDINFNKIENIFDAEIYYPNGELLCEEIGMELNTDTAVLEGYRCEIKQVPDGNLNLLLSLDLMQWMGLDPSTDEPVIEGFSVIN